MKKVLFIAFAIIIALSSAGFAAKLSAPAGDSGKMGLGFWGGTPTLRYNFTNDARGQLGLAFTSGAGTSTFTLLLGGDVDVTRISGNEVNMGGLFAMTSVAGASTWTAALTCGVDVKIAPAVVLELKVFPISVNGASGATTTTIGILNAATVGAHIYL